MGWYFQSAANGDASGPCTPQEIQKAYTEGKLDGLTLCWQDGMPEWRPLADLAELKSLLVGEEEEEKDEQLSRLPLSEVSAELKYITPEGEGRVFDTHKKQWLTFAEYNALVDKDPPDLKLKENQNHRKRKRTKKKSLANPTKPKINTNVYVSGLPEDVTRSELEIHFRRAGVMKLDPETGLTKIKIYRTSDDAKNKGDALISFLKPESVFLAVKYLDESEIRPGFKIHVEEAQFSQSQHQLPPPPQTAKEKEALKKRFIAIKKEERRQLDWNEGITSTSDTKKRSMILRPLWTLDEAFEKDKTFYESLSSSITKSLEEWISIKRAIPIERHPKGIVQIRLHNHIDCEMAIAQLDSASFSRLHLPQRHAVLLLDAFQETHRQQVINNVSEAEVEIFLKDHLTTQQTQLFQEVEKLYQNKSDNKRQKIDLNLWRYNLAQFILEDPIKIEAYVDDGTDLTAQAVPLEVVEEKAEKDRDKKWAEWLEGSGDDSDDEDLKVVTED